MDLPAILTENRKVCNLYNSFFLLWRKRHIVKFCTLWGEKIVKTRKNFWTDREDNSMIIYVISSAFCPKAKK